MGIANKIQSIEVKSGNHLEEGKYECRLIGFRDEEKKTKDGSKVNVCVARIVIDWASEGSVSRIGDVKEISFWMNREAGEEQLLRFYASLEGEGKEHMTPEAFKTWDDAGLFAKRLEVAPPKDLNDTKAMEKFVNKQKDIEELMLGVGVIAKKNTSQKDNKSYTNYSYVKAGRLSEQQDVAANEEEVF